MRVLVIAPGRGGGLSAEEIFAGSCADFDAFPGDVEIAGFCGNSLGFYTTLALAGALSREEGARLVATMSRLQAEKNRGSQLIYPVVDDEWRPVPERRAAVLAAIESGSAFDSIRLGGFAVLAARDPRSVRLPAVRQGGRDYPLVLEGHQGFHSPFAEPVAEAARRELSGLAWRAPGRHVVDGRGVIFSPWSADPAEIARYSLGEQLTAPFDFATQLVTGVRELAPDVLVLLGPGEGIGGAIGTILVRERFFGLGSKQAFQERQKSSEPVLHALGRPEQRAKFL